MVGPLVAYIGGEASRWRRFVSPTSCCAGGRFGTSDPVGGRLAGRVVDHRTACDPCSRSVRAGTVSPTTTSRPSMKTRRKPSGAGRADPVARLPDLLGPELHHLGGR